MGPLHKYQRTFLYSKNSCSARVKSTFFSERVVNAWNGHSLANKTVVQLRPKSATGSIHTYQHKNFIKMMTNRTTVTIQYILKYYDIQH